MKILLAAFVFGALRRLAGTSAGACRDPGGIGGTGIVPGGTGGTGSNPAAPRSIRRDRRHRPARRGGDRRARRDHRFGSICVNGIEVHYDATTPVALNGDLSSASALGIGQVVSVLAVGAGTQARAHWIDVVDAAVGPITAVENAGAILQVNKERVRIEPSTVLGPGLERARLASAQVGDLLRVSGLRSADGTIAATRVEAAAPGTRALAGRAGPTRPRPVPRRGVRHGHRAPGAARGADPLQRRARRRLAARSRATGSTRGPQRRWAIASSSGQTS
jgi:hypothetical protein